MAADTQALLLDLVEWLAGRPRPYDAVMAAWRTSCPNLTIWEDALDQGLVGRERRNGGATFVVVTPLGRELLAQAGRQAAPAIPSAGGDPKYPARHRRRG